MPAATLVDVIGAGMEGTGRACRNSPEETAHEHGNVSDGMVTGETGNRRRVEVSYEVDNQREI